MLLFPLFYLWNTKLSTGEIDEFVNTVAEAIYQKQNSIHFSFLEIKLFSPIRYNVR